MVCHSPACKLLLNLSSRFGRDNFQESMKISHRMDHDKIDWPSFRFMVFDVPTSKGNYQERYHQLRMATFLPSFHFGYWLGYHQESTLRVNPTGLSQLLPIHYVKEQIILRRYFRISWIKEEKESSCEILQVLFNQVDRVDSSNTR